MARRKQISLGLGRDVTILVVMMGLWELAFGLYSNFFTIYIESLGATATVIGILIGMQGLVRIAMTLPAGVIADRVNWKWLIVGSSAITIPGVLFYGFAPSWPWMIPGMVMMAMTSISMPAISAYISAAEPAERRARTFTMVYSFGPGVAIILAPLAGGLIADTWSMSRIFLFSSVVFMLTAAVGMRMSSRGHSRTDDEVEGTYREAFMIPAIRWVGLMQLSVLLVLGIGVTLLPNYLRDSRGFSLKDIGYLGALSAIGGLTLSLAVGRFRRLTPNRGIAIGTLALGLVCLVVATADIRWLIFATWFFRGGFMVAWTLCAAAMGDVAPARLRGRAFGLAEFLGGIGFGLSPFIAGVLYDWKPSAPLILCGVLAPFVALAALVIERRFVVPAKQVLTDIAAAVPVTA